MWGLKGLSKLVVVAMSVATLTLMAAVGAAAASGTLGSGKALTALVNAVVPSAAQGVNGGPKSEKTADENNGDNGKHKGECHPPKKTHKHGTPGHKNHPCGEDGDDSD